MCGAVLAGLCFPQFAAAGGYSPTVPFQNKEAPSQIIGGVYIPAHEEPVMIQPGSVPFGTKKASVEIGDNADQSALNSLASQAQNPQAEAALHSLEHNHGGSGMKIKSDGSHPPVMGAVTQIPVATKKNARPTITSFATAIGASTTPTTLSTPMADIAVANTPKHSLVVTVNKHTMAAPQPVFIALGGKKLSTTLVAFLKRHHWNLLWNDQKDITPDFTATYSGKSVSSILNQIQNTYPQFNFSMWGVNRVVTVTPYSDQNAVTTFSGVK